MKLHYLYVNGFKMFRGCEMSFSDEYAVRFDGESEIEVRRCDSSVPDRFFAVGAQSGATVCNVPAVVGENGSGKTSLASFLLVEEPKRSGGWLSPLKCVMKIDDVYNALFKRNAVEFISDRICQESAYSSYAFPSLSAKSIRDLLYRQIDDRILSQGNYNERPLSKCLSDVDEDVSLGCNGGF